MPQPERIFIVSFYKVRYQFTLAYYNRKKGESSIEPVSSNFFQQKKALQFARLF
jgi:hypothetical protein